MSLNLGTVSEWPRNPFFPLPSLIFPPLSLDGTVQGGLECPQISLLLFPPPPWV